MAATSEALTAAITAAATAAVIAAQSDCRAAQERAAALSDARRECCRLYHRARRARLKRSRGMDPALHALANRRPNESDEAYESRMARNRLQREWRERSRSQPRAIAIRPSP
jgi:hypothetical protein